MRGPALVTAAVLMAPAAKADLLHCHMLVALASPALGQVTSGSVDKVENGCLYQDLRSAGRPGARPAMQADRVMLSGLGFEDLVEQGAPTRDLVLELRGLRLQPDADMLLPRWEHLLLTRNTPLNLSLIYHWDEDSRELQIETLDLDFGTEGRLHLQGKINEVDLRSKDTAAISVGSMAITELHLDFSSSGLFEALMVPLFGSHLLDDFASPEAGIEVLKTAALEALTKVPTDILDPASSGELSRFVTSLPEPDGTLSLELNAAPGLGAPRFFGFAMTGVPRAADEFWAAFSGVTLRADWAPVN